MPCHITRISKNMQRMSAPILIKRNMVITGWILQDMKPMKVSVLRKQQIMTGIPLLLLGKTYISLGTTISPHISSGNKSVMKMI